MNGKKKSQDEKERLITTNRIKYKIDIKKFPYQFTGKEEKLKKKKDQRIWKKKNNHRTLRKKNL